jgi:hypothetical protein
MDPDLRELLSALNAHSVKYLVIGAYAVGVHAEPRATKDLDIWIKADAENSRAVFHALAAFGAPLAGLSPNDFNDEAGSVFQMGQPPLRVDILQRIDGVTFEDAWQNRMVTQIGGELPAFVISAEDLIRNKLAAGRPQGLLDAAKVQKAQAGSTA